MQSATVLVIGSGPAAWETAARLARAGVDVTLAGDPGRDAEATDPVVDVRADVTMIGHTEIDHHVEAELSDGRVENFDAIITTDGGVSVLCDPGGLWQRSLHQLVESGLH